MKVRAPRPAWAMLLQDEGGSSIVEFGMGLIVLLCVIFGILSICYAVYTFNFLSEAAREGSRYAIVRGSACTSFGTACPATQTDIQNYVKNIGFPGINPSNMNVAVAWSAYPAGGACQPSASCNNPGNQVKVTVTYSFPLAIPFISSRTLSMSNSAAMVISQ